MGEVPIAIGREGGINLKDNNFIHDYRHSFIKIFNLAPL